MFLHFCVPNICSYQISMFSNPLFCTYIHFLFLFSFFLLFCIPPFHIGTLAAITIKPASLRLIEHACLHVESHVVERDRDP